eukprot:TRINITY_DN3673_c0_g1_i5.p1 TRINITY_DN3673_c0_g1~~TRINITY_DN3673_c0_g1_i5.p1  ORF type:complete len:222 (+),score=32.13 TRINITY_DN3673_c0_g1_i5:77-742(+)
MITVESVLEQLAYFLGAYDVFPHIEQVPGRKEPLFPGGFDEFLFSKGLDEPKFRKQLKSPVKVCPRCSKSNGWTLSICNGCGWNISLQALSFSNNVLMGFVYGIRRAPFPLIISVRYADEKFLVFDDLLKLTSCHLNAIPTDVYCPDWRYLLLNPPKGLELINSLRRVAWEVVKTQFLTNLSWKKKFFKNYESLTEGNFEELISYGMNYPPSQSQLHLQVM